MAVAVPISVKHIAKAVAFQPEKERLLNRVELIKIETDYLEEQAAHMS